MTWAELPRSPGHVFYDRLQIELVGTGFDAFVENACAPYHAAKCGRSLLPLGRYFRSKRRPMTAVFAVGAERVLGYFFQCQGSISLVR
ncbi:protein of unknown function [Rhodovastum atsumiense]|uniref:hypothetical protein n=1 Tax=Rhodovastum atsumiense TaxID=504468 RepID=UPI00139F2B70|nr:hypothetical protein [Rhodovastum atsumiense]CAH2603436.1 protein of unknown function [Rhodovastum atsumiense]